ncbi:DNA primase [Desulfonispora thiosulfatigenes]|nr:DNA primase [Desulfonispora thiosulfatigenes]
MKGYIPQEIIDEITARADIVEVIKEFIPLKKEGRNFKGLCPFHHEKTPSFTVSAEKQIFHCFGCGVGGNVYSFLMKMDNISFPESIKRLGEKTGVAIPETEISASEKNKITKRERLFKINDLTSRFYHKILVDSKQGKLAREYLQKRGINLETINKFKIGYAIDSWDSLLKFMMKKDIKPQELLDLGLISPRKSGNGYYDRFRGRLIFPIWDSRGGVVAFGARILGQGEPKYLNSPDTPLFNKSYHLYGINLAKNNIRDKDMALIVEGYMDVIACYQHGVKNAVASLGTAFTKYQANLLMRYSYNLGICYDADAAGSKASLRGLDVLSDLGCNVSVINLPKGLDPDEYLQKEGKDGLELLIKDGQSLIEYKLTHSMENNEIIAIQGKLKVIEDLAEDLLKMKSFVLRQGAIDLISKKLGLPSETIISELKKINQEVKKAYNFRDTKDNQRDNKTINYDHFNKVEILTLKLIIENNKLFTEIENVGGAKLFTSTLQEFYQEIYKLYLETGEVSSSNFSENKYSNLFAYIMMQENKASNIKKAFFDYLKNLRLLFLETEYNAKKTKLQEAEKNGNVDELNKLLFDIDTILQEKKVIDTLGG